MNPKTILIIEPEESAINGLTAFLARDFRVIGVPFYSRALNILSEKVIDLIILSRCLPDGSSLEILGKLRRKFPGLPIILMAESPNQEYIISAFRLGANDFFVKPVNEMLLGRRLNQLLEAGTIQPDSDRKEKIQDEFTHRYDPKKQNWFKTIFSLFRPTFHVEAGGDETELYGDETQSKVGKTRQAPQKYGDSASSVEENPPILFVNYLGKFQVIVNQQVIDEWPGRKTEDVFAYLAYYHKRHIHRDVLMDRFWPNSSPDSARNCLNVTLHAIRKTFEKFDSSRNYICYKHECYFIHPEIELKIDVEDFLLFWKLAQTTERENGIDAALSKYELAAATYNGDFMGENFCGTWADLDRENLKEIYMEILNKLSKYYSLDGKPDVAINLCDLILKKDNCREDVHRRLMRCYYRVGQRDKAIRQFNKCAEILEFELELSPSRATLQLFEKIRQNQ